MTKSNARGFTLIELLVVISIIGILSTIIVAGLGNAKIASRDAKRVSDIKNIQLSLALYYNDNQHYPCSIYASAGATVVCQPDFSPTYMQTVPLNNNTTQYVYSSFVQPSSINCTNKYTEYYHLGAPMEQIGGSLTLQDADASSSAPYATACSVSSPQFGGITAACTGATPMGATAAMDGCYDVVPNF